MPVSRINRDRAIIVNPLLREGFAQIPRPVLRARNLSTNAKTIYGLLVDYAGQDGSCFPGQETLAEECGLSIRHLSRVLADLRDYGLIEWHRRKQSSNLYIILDYHDSPEIEVHGIRGREYLINTRIESRSDTGVRSSDDDPRLDAGVHSRASRSDAGVQSSLLDRTPAPLDRTPASDERYSDNNTQLGPERYPDASSNNVLEEESESALTTEQAPSKLSAGATWAAAIVNLREEVPPAQYQMLLRPLTAIEWRAGDLILAAPSSYIRDQIAPRLDRQICQAISEVIGEVVAIRVESPEGGNVDR